MDWSRAKTILICAFFVLDLFLGYQVYASRTQPAMDVESVKGGIYELQSYLQQQNISLDAEVPQETPDMRYLNVEYLALPTLVNKDLPDQQLTYENSAIHSQFVRPVGIAPYSSPGDLLRQLKDRILYWDQYQSDSYLFGKQGYTFWQTHEGVPLYVAKLELQIDNNAIKGYKQTYLHIRSQGSGRQVISAVTAIRSLVEKHIIKKGERIENVSLGYFGYRYDADIQVLAPVWRVIHDGNINYVNGFTGVTERPPSAT